MMNAIKEFLNGAVSLYTGGHTNYITPIKTSDYDMIKQDWINVGNDLRKSIDDYE